MELLEIEKELRGPQREAAVKRYDDMLVALDVRRKSSLANGLPPDEYARVEPLGEAITIARKLIRLQAKG